MMNFTYSLLMVILISGCQEKKFPSGKDTFESFGDGRFQIGYLSGDTLILDDGHTQDVIVYGVKDYLINGNFVFVLGDDGKYTLLNYVSGVYQKFNLLGETPVEHKSQFKKLGRSRVRNWIIKIRKELKINW